MTTSLRRTALLQGPPGPPGVVKSAVTAWTPGSINNNAFASLAVTVTGAIVGLPCIPPAWSVALPNGVFTWAQCTSAGSVTVYIFNMSGSTQVIAAGNVYVEALTS